MEGSNPKRPTWATVVGVLAIIFGISGLLGNLGYTLLLPKIIQVVNKVQKFGVSRPLKPEQQASLQQAREMMDAFFGQLPGWIGAWIIPLALLSFLVSLIYVSAGIALLRVKWWALNLFYAAIALSIGFAVLRQMIFGQAYSSFMSVSMLSGTIVGIFIDLILLIVVLTNDRQVFTHPGS